MTLERFLTVEEVADLLRTTPSALYSSRHRSEAPGALAVQVGRRLLWRPSDLEMWLDEVAASRMEPAPLAPHRT